MQSVEAGAEAIPSQSASDEQPQWMASLTNTCENYNQQLPEVSPCSNSRIPGTPNPKYFVVHFRHESFS